MHSLCRCTSEISTGATEHLQQRLPEPTKLVSGWAAFAPLTFPHPAVRCASATYSYGLRNGAEPYKRAWENSSDVLDLDIQNLECVLTCKEVTKYN